jgi:serine protease Do
MMFVQKVRQQKVLSVTLMVFTLAIGIVLGTLINTGVRADKGDKPVTDATPLTIPSPVQLANDFTTLVKKMEPAVVNISTTYEAKRQPAASERKQRKQRNQDDEDSDEDGFDIFRFFRGPQGDAIPRQRREGTGSGFIVDPKGYIITNHHVTDNADKLIVKLHGDPTEYKAKVIGIDHEIDLAVIKIDAGKPLPYTAVGNSEAVQVGDWAIAIGSPFGLEASVTAGIVSAKGRSNVGQQFQSFIQTDAAINPGNSGGPLLNIKGEVIGVNTMIATQSGGYQGIGFALPINTAVKSYNQIIKYGQVTRGSIGISWGRGQEKPELFKALGIKGGVIVETVKSGGPAEKAGVKSEDIITAINGKSLKDGEDLVAKVADTPIGEKLTLMVDRGGKKMEFPVTVRARAEVFADEPQFARFRKKNDESSKDEGTEVKFGIYVKPLAPADREDLKLDSDRGVMVTRVQEESFAGEVGLRENDVILSINRQPVSGIEDIRKIQGNLKPGDAVAFRVARPNPLAARAGGPKHTTFFLSGTLPRQ